MRTKEKPVERPVFPVSGPFPQKIDQSSRVAAGVDRPGTFPPVPKIALFSVAPLCYPALVKMSIATKRITSKSSMSITSTTTKKTISASGAWRNS
jgi:hypothetical protein